VNGRRGSCPTSCGGTSSRCCRCDPAGSAAPDAAGSRIGRCCAGSCSCCIPASSGSSCRRNSGSARHDVLAAAGRVERRRRLAPAARAGAGRVARGRAARLVPGGDRLLAPAGGTPRPKSGPSPVDRARPGSQHHLPTEGANIPLVVSLTGGNRNDITQLLPLLEKIPPVRGRRGQPRCRPDALYADRAYDHEKYRPAVRHRGSGRTSPAAASHTAPGSASTAGSWNAPCAPRGALSYPRFSREGLEGRFLG
jgi:hypothetical protein